MQVHHPGIALLVGKAQAGEGCVLLLQRSLSQGKAERGRLGTRSMPGKLPLTVTHQAGASSASGKGSSLGLIGSTQGHDLLGICQRTLEEAEPFCGSEPNSEHVNGLRFELEQFVAESQRFGEAAGGDQEIAEIGP